MNINATRITKPQPNQWTEVSKVDSSKTATNFQEKDTALRARTLHTEALGMIDLFEISDNTGNDMDPREGFVTLKTQPIYPHDLGDKSPRFSGTYERGGLLDVTSSNGGRLQAQRNDGGMVVRRDLESHKNDRYLDTIDYLESDNNGNMTLTFQYAEG